ncbi:MAG: 7-carboxy-7-deazaguanine synthase QueE [Rikenellaceae bacterium]
MSGEKLAVVEAFYTIQGEGANTGRAAYFIRLAGCDVCCAWCDARESWAAGRYEQQSVESIVEGVRAAGARTVVITGGEPLMHNLDELTRALHRMGCEVLLESSGSHPLSGEFDWICISPKRRKMPMAWAYGAASELKMVISGAEDFTLARECAQRVGEGCRLYLQPEWSVAKEVMDLIVEYVKANPRWRVSLQTHKYMEIP